MRSSASAASKFPNPVFIDTEGSTKQLDVARFDAPTSWEMLLQEVDYIKSDGYAYINSGVYGNQDSGVELDFKVDVIADATMFGARTSSTSNAFYILIRGGTYFASAYESSRTRTL